jgi:hypothetical protein
MAAYKERHKEEIAAAKAAKLAAKEHLRTPNGGYLLKFSSIEEQQASYRAQNKAAAKRTKARLKAQRATALAETEAAARIFIRDVPPLLSYQRSPIRTRLFIALCERGPIRVRDAGLAVSDANHVPIAAALERLVAMGVVAKTNVTGGYHPDYYLNPGHPTHAQLLRFGQRLAKRWPSPPRRIRKVLEEPVPVPTTAPCAFFGTEARSRLLLMIAVSGGMFPAQANVAGFMVSRDEVDRTLRGAQRQGLVAREPVPTGRGAGQGQARRYFLDPQFFAFAELRALCFALVATLYDDIAGIAAAMGRHDKHVARNLDVFMKETAHLRVW